MFILPVTAYPFDLAPTAFPGAPAWNAWISPLHLPLTLLVTLVVLALVRALFAARSRARSIPVTAEKLEKAPAASAASDPKPELPGSSSKRSFSLWPSFALLKWETLPPISLADALPITLHPPPPPPMRGRHVYRGGRGVGFVRRPEPALSTRPQVEAPLPAIYASPTPASMAKLIMSRHTYRRPAAPSPRRAASPAPAPEPASAPASESAPAA